MVNLDHYESEITLLKRRQIGENAEEKACEYLKQQGLQLLQRNFSCKLVEIYLIMQANQQVLFVEVRYRRSTSFGSLESITLSKQKKLIKTAQWFLKKYSFAAETQYRFDVVAFDANEIQWIKDAFQV
jgi:putative endonuclease